jgi:hypothetical protein
LRAGVKGSPQELVTTTATVVLLPGGDRHAADRWCTRTPACDGRELGQIGIEAPLGRGVVERLEVKVHLACARAVSGDTIPVQVSGGRVRVDGAHVVKTDIAASNGVIHVVDAVILPND